LTSAKKISVSGAFSLGIRTYDQMNEVYNKNGVYYIELFLDNEQVFGLEMNKLSFATTRYINSLIDYPYSKLKKRSLVRTQIDTNNRLFNYRDVSNNGVFSFSDTLSHTFKYKVSDVYKNTSELTFRMDAVKPDTVFDMQNISKDEGLFFKFSQANKIDKSWVSLAFPANAFYRSFYFHLDSFPAGKGMYAPVLQAHNKFTPVQKSFTISIVPDTIPENLKTKMYIAYINGEGKHFFIGAQWKGNKLTAKSKLLGNYSILADTISPEIKALNFNNGKNVSKQNTLKISIKEKQTGIKFYRGTLNNKWILMEYDPKKNRLTYTFDEHIQKGENNFKLVVKDLLGNEAVYQAVIWY
jgi:hypothetical protein